MFQRIKAWVSRMLAIAVVAASFAGYAGTGASASTDVLTVAQAIANNTGKGTVEGYIVAHTTGNNAYNFNAPFGGDTNFAIADSALERDKSKIMPVQLPATFRPQFGLQTNPGNIGKKVRVTGNLAAYFTVPGLRDTTSVLFVQPGDDQPKLVTVAEAKQKAGQTVIVEGVVMADNSAIGGGRLSTYLQDATAGINIFAFDATKFPTLREGDQLRITGSITEFRGLMEIEPRANGIEVLATGAALPAPVTATIADLQSAATAEPLEGKLVKVSGYVQNVPATPAGGGYNVTIIDNSFKGLTLRIMEGTQAISSVQTGVWYEFTAIASQYDSYQLLPRRAADIVRIEPQPKAPSAAGDYDAVVASITDGDTIKLSNPVLGAVNVRMLNIDTAETYHKVVNDLDRNQMEHGLAAKAYINTLIKAGDAVVLKIGEEPTDDYGRLLAQVIRKSDGLNVNLEMVEKGYAATYFIWPIGNEYELFSQAVKRAYDAKLGIWNPADPLLELPFEFRAREQGKGLTRHVGHYYTKKFVTPEKWSTVPVEARVFFNSEAEALANGYTPKGEEPKENVKIQLLGVNDLHGKIDVTTTLANRPGVSFGRADYLAAYLRQREATNPNTLIIHSGDMVGGSSPVSALLQDEPTVEIMHAIGFDVGTVGNHEFDEGVTEMLRMIYGGEHPNGTKGYAGMNFPVVVSNVEYKDTGALVLPPYAIKEIAGQKLGFIGVATTATPSMVMPTGISTIRFTDEATAINKYVPELQAQGVEAIVVLAHVPGEQNGTGAKGEIATMANKISDAVDIIFAAHNHVKLNATVGNKLIVQAWEYGNAFVDIDIEISPITGDIVKKSAEIVEVIQQDMVPDAQVAAILAKYSALVAPKINAVVGQNELELLKGYPTKLAVGDMALGNFLADGMAYAMQADVALMNGGGVRDNIDVGPITWGELFNVQPFGNTLVKVDVTGAQLVDILNAMINPLYGPDSFIGGKMRYTWNPATNKVVRLMWQDGTLVDPNGVYSLVVNNYMYNQTSAKYKLIQQYGRNFEQGPEDIEGSVLFAKSIQGPIRYEAEARISTDLTAPMTAAAVGGLTGEAYNKDDVAVLFSATDEGSGVKRTEYRVNGGAWTLGTQLTLNADGVYMVQYRSVDRALNTEDVQSIVVRIDRVAPVITAPAAVVLYPYEAYETVITAVDSGSGLAQLKVTLNGKPAEAALKIAPFQLKEETHTVVVEAADHAGNTASRSFTIEVRMDLAHADELLQYGLESGKVDASIFKSLSEKVANAQKAPNANSRAGMLKALTNELRAQSGKKVDAAFAARMIEAIEKF